MTRILSLLICLMVTTPVWGAPRDYAVDKSNSRVGFGYAFGAQKLRGRFESYDIDLVLDLQTVAKSSVRVRMDVNSARTSLPFAAEALRGASILDAKQFPTITFRTTKVTGSGNTARLDGLATIKGVTKPLTLTAKLFRPKGSAKGDMDKLILRITGSLDRRDFGADGYIKEVDPILSIDIKTYVIAR